MKYSPSLEPNLTCGVSRPLSILNWAVSKTINIQQTSAYNERSSEFCEPFNDVLSRMAGHNCELHNRAVLGPSDSLFDSEFDAV